VTPLDLETLETKLFELECQILRKEAKEYKRATED